MISKDKIKTHMKYSITIDGPAGSGKSTLAKNIQKKLNAFALVDTGAYYRWATYLCLENDVDIDSKSKVYSLVKDKMELIFIPYPRGHKYYSAKIMHDGELINKKIYSAKVTDNVPIIAQYKRVRDLVKKKIRELGKEYNLVVAGRDIGTEVLPKSEIKIFLNPSIDSRARRRYRDQVKQGRSISYGDMKSKMNERDHHDKSREHGPLIKPEDSFEIDNTYMTTSQCLKEVMKIIEKNEPDILHLEKIDWKNIENSLTPTSSFSSSSSYTSSFSPTTSISEEKKESVAEMKKRLKAKYKSSQSSEGGFFNKY